MEDSKVLKKGFFKKVWYSIFKLEKYGEMAAEGVPRAIFYTIKLSLIISLVTALGSVYQVNKLVDKGKDFLETQVGEFTYKDGILDVEKEEPIIAPSSTFGQIIINTKTESDEEVNQILNSLNSTGGIVILKDSIIIKGYTTSGTVSYKYADLMQGMNIQEASKQDVINLINGGNLTKLFIAIVIVITLYMLLSFTLQFLWYNVVLSLFGFIATFFSRIKMRYAAIFNMACYSFTLSILLQTIYIGINIFWEFEIKYFQVMYIAVAAIYLIAAIFLIKSEFLKQQIEVAKMVEIKKHEENEQKDNDEQEENKEPKKPEEKNPEEKKEKKDKKDDKQGGIEPEGSKA